MGGIELECKCSPGRSRAGGVARRDAVRAAAIGCLDLNGGGMQAGVAARR